MRTIEKKIAHVGAGVLTVPFENQNNGGITITARDVPDNPANPVGGDIAILAVFEDGTEAEFTSIPIVPPATLGLPSGDCNALVLDFPVNNIKVQFTPDPLTAANPGNLYLKLTPKPVR